MCGIFALINNDTNTNIVQNNFNKNKNKRTRILNYETL